ncbi:Zn-dependent hydrolase of the beta-lactamase fold [Halanaeroarchaeum sp. HSR-CO]|uniref:MBL fold metallo-hydrolase n=1 Tax=Halanaeroarchaeum sp. HSR-CO TaxID=2866382 RepID=UPI00217EADF9|nr:MBL fold metallo-hydrolase [Halanaeroarchaeum sp. HSR-CO]UWG46966.1 Zn-dependent hydrolase of the beta-lactamase fold [Halanaeroarchaeum sp. HSR-CO]
MSTTPSALRLLRHATLVVRYGGATVLVDPMLADEGSTPPIENSPNEKRNPLVPLPTVDLRAIDAVAVTHTHRDHFDEVAMETLPSDLPLFCQPPDEETIEKAGFTDVRPVEDSVEWEGITITRTGGRHGHDDLAEKMGPVSGFVFTADEEPSLYVAGDTRWCAELCNAFATHTPDVIVVNAGGARFDEGKPITMTAADVERVCRARPNATVIPVHMDAINHCLESRADLEQALTEAGVISQVVIPEDGEWVPLE